MTHKEAPALVTDFKGEQKECPAEDHTGEYGHHLFRFDNGYVVSVLRSTEESYLIHKTFGHENEGRWEALVGLVTPMSEALGIAAMPLVRDENCPVRELLTHEHRLDGQPEDTPGLWVAGDLDNAGVNALLTAVAELPTPEDVEDLTEGMF